MESTKTTSTASAAENSAGLLAQGSVLMIGSVSDRGIRSAGHALATLLSRGPYNLEVITADLPEALAHRALIPSLASWAGARLETAVLASLAWPIIEEQVKKNPPRVVVAMDPGAAVVVDLWRAKGQITAPQVGIISGLRLDPAWAHTAVDRLSVADEIQAEAALSLGLPPEVIVPSGVPVCSTFASAESDNQEQLRQRFHLPPHRPVVLTVTDGLSLDQLSNAFFQLSMVTQKATLLFDVSRDEEAAELLRRRARLYEIQAQLFGKVDEAGDLWAASTVVVAKPYTYVEQRTLALRLPLICLLPQTPEEKETARLHVGRGIGRAVDHLSTLAAEIELQLGQEALSKAVHLIAKISRRSASQELARMIAQVRANASQILSESQERLAQSTSTDTPVSSSPTETKVKQAGQVGPLETIGGVLENNIHETYRPESPTAAWWVEDLEQAEIDASKQMMAHQQEAEQWRRWADLAAEKGEEGLKLEAEKRAEQHHAAMHRALAELARLAEQRKTVGYQQPLPEARLEQTFRKMEVEEALAALKRKRDE